MKRFEKSRKLIFLMLLFGLILLVGCTDNSEDKPEKNNENPDTNSYKTVSTGSTESGDVLMDLTPKGMENGKFIVDFSANTHSVDLSQFDLKQITTLEYDGNSLNPTSSPSLSGHHNSGTLEFDTGIELKSFKIIIRDIPDIQERVFEWP